MAQWWAQYHEQTPNKMKISDMLKKDTGFVEEKKSVRMDGTRKSPNTSAWVLDLDTLTIKEDLMEAIEWQRLEGTMMNETPGQNGQAMSNTSHVHKESGYMPGQQDMFTKPDIDDLPF